MEHVSSDFHPDDGEGHKCPAPAPSDPYDFRLRRPADLTLYVMLRLSEA